MGGDEFCLVAPLGAEAPEPLVRRADDAIPLGASIIAVCDAFDAMVTDRPDRDATSTADALVELRRCSSTQFHPGVTDAFCALIEEHEAAAAQPA